MPECNELLRSYFEWLRTETVLLRMKGFWRLQHHLSTGITTTYKYVERTSSGLRLTDDGYTIHDLEMHGCNLDTPKRVDMLESILGALP